MRPFIVACAAVLGVAGAAQAAQIELPAGAAPRARLAQATAPTPAPTPLAPVTPLEPVSPTTGMPAAAAQAGPAPTIDLAPKASPEAIAAARKIGDRLNFEAQARTLLSGMRTQVVGALARNAGKPPAEVMASADELIMPAFTAKTDELVEIIVEHWAESFTPEELHQLDVFYGSPLGEKLTHTVPALGQAVLKDAQGWGNNILHATIAAHGDELRARGLLKN